MSPKFAGNVPFLPRCRHPRVLSRGLRIICEALKVTLEPINPRYHLKGLGVVCRTLKVALGRQASAGNLQDLHFSMRIAYFTIENGLNMETELVPILANVIHGLLTMAPLNTMMDGLGKHQEIYVGNADRAERHHRCHHEMQMRIGSHVVEGHGIDRAILCPHRMLRRPGCTAETTQRWTERYIGNHTVVVHAVVHPCQRCVMKSVALLDDAPQYVGHPHKLHPAA